MSSHLVDSLAERLSQAEEEAEQLIATAEKSPEKLLDLSNGGSKWKSIHQKLCELYVEESKRVPLCKNLKPNSQILAKLINREGLNTLVVNLYPGNEGYSMMLRGRNGYDAETIRLPYEESDLLDYIDNEELPPVLVDLLEKSQANLFYSGCVIVELRDHRRTTNNSYDTQYVLLRPTPQTMLCDINALTNDGHRWTQEDKFNLESQLLLHTNEPLCLDPSPTVFYAANKLNYHKNKMNSCILKRSVKKFSQSAVNRKRKMAQCSAPKTLRLHDFITRKRDKLKTAPPVNLKVNVKTHVDMWRERDVELTMPPTIDVDSYTKQLKKPDPTLDNTPAIVEEYTLETERSQGKVYLTRLTIQQRLTDEFYLGELYVDRDLRQGTSKGSICRFPLGTRANVEKYIKQFTEIFTEEGRRSVKITHQVPGQQATVTFTHAMPSYTPATTTTAGSTSAQTLLTQAQNLAATISASSSGGESPGAPPQAPAGQQSYKLSLHINPPHPPTVHGQTLMSPPNAGQPLVENGVHHVTVGSQQVTLQPLTSSQAPQQIAHARRISSGMLGNLQRPSPVSTPTSQQAFLPSYNQAIGQPGTPSPSQLMPRSQHPTPPSTPSTPRPTPPNLLPLHSPQLTPHRRHTMESKPAFTVGNGSTPSTPSSTPTPQGDNKPPELAVAAVPATNMQMSVQQGSTGMSVQQSTGMTVQQNPTINVQQSPTVNVQLANLTGLQGNINLSQLTGITSLPQGLVQVASVTMPGGSIAVPLSMINTISGQPASIISAGQPAGLIVSTLAGGTAPTATSTTTAANTAAPGNLPAEVTSPPPAFVATALPANASNIATATIPSTMTAPSNTVQVPISNLQHIMAANIRPGLRPGGPLSVLQIPGQQPLQLVPTSSLPRGQLAAQQLQTQLQAGKPTILTAQSIQGIQQIGGQAAPGQILQLNPQQQQLLLQHKQLQAIQLQQLQTQAPIAQPQVAAAHQQPQGSKQRNRKRPGPTPPKQ